MSSSIIELPVPRAGSVVKSAFRAQEVAGGTTTVKKGLWSASFFGFLATQFLGALNDNMFRWLIVPIGKHRVGPEHESLALSAGLACFVLPYILLAGPAGYLADRFSKRSVMIACKVAEVLIVLLGVAAICTGSLVALFSVLFLLGAQSALFGPSKFGSIPELVHPRELSIANGLVGMSTVLAIVLGTVAGNYLFYWTGPDGMTNLGLSAGALIGIAVLGLLASLKMVPMQAASPDQEFPRNPFGQTYRELVELSKSGPIWRVALASAFFWSLASLSQLNVDAYGINELGLEQHQIGPLLGILALGVGLGNVLAGVFSRGKVELGLVPIGAFGIAGASLLLTTSSHSYGMTSMWLLAMGLCAGLFDVPLQSYLQSRSPAERRGSILAAANLLVFSGAIAVAGLFSLLRGPLDLEPRYVFLAAGLATLPVALAAGRQLWTKTFRLLVSGIVRTFYRVRVEGLDNVPASGPALLIPNHVSWIDGLLLLLHSPRPVRMVAYADYVEGWWVRWLSRAYGVIPIRPEGGPKELLKSLRTIQEALLQGELVCIFPEGGITRDGQLKAFKPGALRAARGTGAVVVPVYLEGLWGSIFSYQGGKLFAKLPTRLPYPVGIRFGAPLAQPESPEDLRRAVLDLGGQSVSQNKPPRVNLLRAFLRECRRSRSRGKIGDSTGKELNGTQLLMGTILFKRLLEREVLAKDEKFVGLLIPPAIGSVLANVALPLSGRVAVNLNYTVSTDVMNSCIQQCGIKHVLTSRQVTKRLSIDPAKIAAEFVYLEDIYPSRVKVSDKIIAALLGYLVPTGILERMFGLHKIQDDDLLTILFTSGSTGEPKGVMLTHRNVASNVYAIDEAVELNDRDVSIGVLPFFHSYGYTATLWTALSLVPKAVYHFTPLDAKVVGELARKHHATILMTTPTFLRSYLKRCADEDFRSLDVVFASAEKLPAELVTAYEKKFGMRPYEAYGATELSPLVAVNVPASRSRGVPNAKEGSVGRPIPGVLVKLVHPETGQPVAQGEPGLLLVGGPGVMKGYFKKPQLTADAIRDGWYVTGDIARIDDEGYVFITGRQSRFSKIGGEMVPHIMIEERLQKALDVDEDDLLLAVTAVPDRRKGERLVVLHKPLPNSPEQICRELSESGLPNLWIPSPDSFCEVDEIPVLGTGKLDLKRLKDLALEKFANQASQVE